MVARSVFRDQTADRRDGSQIACLVSFTIFSWKWAKQIFVKRSELPTSKPYTRESTFSTWPYRPRHAKVEDRWLWFLGPDTERNICVDKLAVNLGILCESCKKTRYAFKMIIMILQGLERLHSPLKGPLNVDWERRHRKSRPLAHFKLFFVK
jgi:hypothetical protein